MLCSRCQIFFQIIIVKTRKLKRNIFRGSTEKNLETSASDVYAETLQIQKSHADEHPTKRTFIWRVPVGSFLLFSINILYQFAGPIRFSNFVDHLRVKFNGDEYSIVTIEIQIPPSLPLDLEQSYDPNSVYNSAGKTNSGNKLR